MVTDGKADIKKSFNLITCKTVLNFLHIGDTGGTRHSAYESQADLLVVGQLVVVPRGGTAGQCIEGQNLVCILISICTSNISSD